MPSELRPDSGPEITAPPKPQRLRDFASGVCLSGIPIGYYLWLSTWATHGSLATVGITKLAVAIAIPCLGGILAAIWGKPVIDSLGKILEGLPG